ncbi:MAG: hypothetical protein Q4F58_01165 [Candidatus Saccharibacteria bacterium]|nr:hypothetical protein [Candidatus Saccharibacteria bacterium]
MSEKLNSESGEIEQNTGGGKNEWEKMADEMGPFNSKRNEGKSAWFKKISEIAKDTGKQVEEFDQTPESWLKRRFFVADGDDARIVIEDDKLRGAAWTESDLEVIGYEFGGGSDDELNTEIDEIAKANDELGKNVEVTTKEDNTALYESLSERFYNILKDTEEDEEDDDEEIERQQAVTKLLQDTLDNLFMNQEEYADGSVRSLESMADQRISKIVGLALTKAKTKNMTKEFVYDAAKKISGLQLLKWHIAEVKSSNNK